MLTTESRADAHLTLARGEILHAGKAVAPGVAALGLLSAFAWHGHVTALDQALTGDIVQQSGSAGFRIGEAVSLVGSGGVVALIAMLVAAFVWRRTGDIVRALAIPFAGGVAGVAELVGKQLVGRLRPVTAIATGESGLGFPSGHTTGFTALAVASGLVLTGVALPTPRLSRVRWLVVGVLSVVVGLARVAVGAHYAFDVLAGLALGVVCAQMALFAADLFGPFAVVHVRSILAGRGRR